MWKKKKKEKMEERKRVLLLSPIAYAMHFSSHYSQIVSISIKQLMVFCKCTSSKQHQLFGVASTYSHQTYFTMIAKSENYMAVNSNRHHTHSPTNSRFCLSRVYHSKLGILMKTYDALIE